MRIKQIFICILQVALVAGFVSCEKGLDDESQFIGSGDGSLPDSGNENWEWAGYYPGGVNRALPVIDTTVTILGQYQPLPYSPETPILQSTGLYAGLDNPITVEVPAGTSNLKWQIGIGHPLAPGQARNRYEDIVRKGSLTEGTNLISSNFGGYVYFYYEPEDVASAQESITVRVSGAHQSLDYIKGSDAATQRYYVNKIKDHVTNLKNTAISDDENVFLYWTELRSPKVILTFGLKEMDFLSNPERLLEQYEKLVDVYLDLAGFDPNVVYKLPPFRVYADVQLPNPRQKNQKNLEEDERRSPGYPIGVLKHSSMRGTSYRDEKRYMNFEDELNFAYTGLQNTAVAMVHSSFQLTTASDWAKAIWLKWPYLRIANMYYCQQISDGRYWGSQPYRNYTMEWQKWINENRLKDIEYVQDLDMKHPWFQGDYRIRPEVSGGIERSNGDVGGAIYGWSDNWSERTRKYEGARATVFLQLIQQYGWGLLKYVNKRAREVGFVNEYEQDAHDFFVMAACEYADADLRPFFRWWQFPFTAHVVQFIRDQGFPELQKTYIGDDSREYYFFDWPGAPEEFFPGNIPQIEPDKWPEGQDPPRKAAAWPEKPYYKEIFSQSASWKAYVEMIETDYGRVGSRPMGQNDGTEYDPDWIPLPSQENDGARDRMGFLSSTYIKQRNGGDTNTAWKLVDNDWINDGRIGRLKGGFGIGNGDYCPNYAILDIDFGEPIKLNAIKTRQPKWDFASSPFGNFIAYIQYYVEPEYTQPADPNDPSSMPVQVKSGSINGVYNHDPEGDPRRVIWNGLNKHYPLGTAEDHPENTVQYPGRTKNKNNDPEKDGYWGFREGGYFAHVYQRPYIRENVLDQDWYYGLIWLYRDGWNRSYVYYLEETIETRRIRMVLRPSIASNRNSGGSSRETDLRGRAGAGMGRSDANAWNIRLREFAFGLVDTEVPAPGTIPMPHAYYKGLSTGQYYGGEATNDRPYGGERAAAL